jgi:hypothetical protein
VLNEKKKRLATALDQRKELEEKLAEALANPRDSDQREYSDAHSGGEESEDDEDGTAGTAAPSWGAPPSALQRSQPPPAAAGAAGPAPTLSIGRNRDRGRVKRETPSASGAGGAAASAGGGVSSQRAPRVPKAAQLPPMAILAQYSSQLPKLEDDDDA